MRIVHVDLGSKSYDIEIERGLLPHVGVKIKTLLPKAEKIAIITDSHVGPLYASLLQKSLEKEGLAVAVLTFPAEGGRSLELAGVKASVESGLLHTDEYAIPLTEKEGMYRLRVISDVHSVEVYEGDGEHAMCVGRALRWKETPFACPGARICPFGCYDTGAFARKMEEMIFPNNLHMKIAFTGCSNDCAKVRMDDFGIIGMTEPQYDKDRCIGCEQCIKYCDKRSVGALSLVNGKIERDTNLCIGCGVCITYCPTRAWTRSKEHYFRVVLLGRTGKQNPRLAEDFIKWCDEESIMKMVKNCYAYVEEYIDPEAIEGKEHVGYIVDRTGFDEFYKWIMEGVELPEKAEVAKRIYWGGKRYDRSNNLK